MRSLVSVSTVCSVMMVLATSHQALAQTYYQQSRSDYERYSAARARMQPVYPMAPVASQAPMPSQMQPAASPRPVAPMPTPAVMPQLSDRPTPQPVATSAPKPSSPASGASLNRTYARPYGKLEDRHPSWVNHWYVGLKGQYVMLNDWEGNGTSGSTPIRGTTTFDSGLGATGTLGYQPIQYLRFEGELAYRKNDMDKNTITDRSTGVTSDVPRDADTDYNFTYFAPMVNAYLEVPLMETGAINPYVGAGVGWLFQRDGAEDDAFAYQLMLGNRSFISNDISVDLEYRYFNTADLFKDAPIEPFNAESHMIGAGINWHFN